MYVSGSTCIFGVALFNLRSAFDNARQPRTAYRFLRRPYRSVVPPSREAFDTKARAVAAPALPCAPNIGRMATGWGVGIDAFASPICDQAMNPPLMTSS